MDGDRWLVDLAASIADGASIDWAAAEARAENPADRELIAKLMTLEQVSRGHVAAVGRTLSPVDASSADVVADTPPLTSWGSFTLLERVGRGTFGDVYRARDPHLDRPVALKLLRRRELQETADIAVIEEARLMARVRHPNVVTVYGADRIQGRVGVWMEFIEGRTLEEVLRADGPFRPDDVSAIGTDLCHALAAVHDAGLLHRDLKAQNVMRDATGRIVLTDFGAGREVSLAPDTAFELAGTPLYIAPEVLAGGVASPQSEVYGLGVLLYHLATNSFPVRGRTLRELREAHGRRNDAPVDFPPQFPAALAAVIERAIEVDPNLRFQSATEMADAFRASSATTLSTPVASAWRLKWLVVMPALLGAALGTGAYLLTPLRYYSQAVIQVVPPKVSPDNSRPLAPQSLEDRVQVMKGPILSRTRLERLINDFDLYKHERETQLMEEVVQTFRDNIRIQVGNGTTAGGGDTTFRVGFTGSEPVQVMKVTERLAGYFKDESLRESTLRAEGTLSFIESQVDSAKRRLAEQQQGAAAARGQTEDRQTRIEREVLEANYRKLLADQQLASTQQNLEARQMGEQFNLIEAARLPERPVSPTRAQMASAGAVGGWVLGLGIAALARVLRRRPRHSYGT